MNNQMIKIMAYNQFNNHYLTKKLTFIEYREYCKMKKKIT